MAAPLILNRAKETTATVGTITYVITPGSAPAGFESLAAAAEKQEPGGGPWEVWYLIVQGSDYEWGRGTLTNLVSDTLTRDAIYASSNGDAAVSWGVGTKDVLSIHPGHTLRWLADYAGTVGYLKQTAQHDGAPVATIPVADGGTGATTAAGARTNLGSGATGDAIFQDSTAADVRTEIEVFKNLSGVTSARPAASGENGTLFFDTLLGLLARSNGSRWQLPPHGRNLIRNGRFSFWHSASGAAGDGWALVSTPSTVELASRPVDAGEGNAIRIVGNSNQGLSQTLSKLRANGFYLARLYVDVASGTCRVNTTGGASNITAPSSGTGPQWLGGIFQVNGTASDVLFRVLSASTGADFKILDCVVQAASEDYGPEPGGGVSIATHPGGTETLPQFSSSEGDALTELTADLRRESTVPGPGYQIVVRATGSIEVSSSNDGHGYLSLQQEIDGGGFSEVAQAFARCGGVASTFKSGWSMEHVIEEPTPGSTYSWQIHGESHNNLINDPTLLESKLVVELRPSVF